MYNSELRVVPKIYPTRSESIQNIHSVAISTGDMIRLALVYTLSFLL